jgi:hypothetical protein
MYKEEVNEEVNRFCDKPHPEIMNRLEELREQGVELFDLYEIDPRTNKRGIHYGKPALSIAELKSMFLGWSKTQRV